MKISTIILPLIIFLALFFYAPFIILGYQSFQGLGGEFTLDNYLALVRDPTYLHVILYSIVIAVETTVITLLLAYPASYYVARIAGGQEKIILLALLLAPFWIDVLLRSIAIKTIIYTIGLREGYTAMMIGMVYEYLPIMFLPIYASMSRISRSAIDAARVFGANTWDLIRRVTVPMTLPGIVAGSLLVLLMSMTEFVIPSLLGGTQGFTIGSLIYYLFLSGGLWGVGAALTMIVTVMLMVFAFIIAKRTGDITAW